MCSQPFGNYLNLQIRQKMRIGRDDQRIRRPGMWLRHRFTKRNLIPNRVTSVCCLFFSFFFFFFFLPFPLSLDVIWSDMVGYGFFLVFSAESSRCVRRNQCSQNPIWIAGKWQGLDAFPHIYVAAEGIAEKRNAEVPLWRYTRHAETNVEPVTIHACTSIARSWYAMHFMRVIINDVYHEELCLSLIPRPARGERHANAWMVPLIHVMLARNEEGYNVITCLGSPDFSSGTAVHHTPCIQLCLSNCHGEVACRWRAICDGLFDTPHEYTNNS